MWIKGEMDAVVKAYREAHPVWHKQVSEEFVELGEWRNAYGIVEDFGSGNLIVFYYGTCPYCGDEVFVDAIYGTYADPTYPPYCPQCGQKLK